MTRISESILIYEIRIGSWILKLDTKKYKNFQRKRDFQIVDGVCVTRKVYKLCRSGPFSSVCCVESISLVCVLVCAVFDDFSCSKSMLNAWMPMSLDNRRSAAPSDGDNRPLFGVSVSSEDCDFVVSPTPEMPSKIVNCCHEWYTNELNLLIDKRRHMSSDCFSNPSTGDVISSA